MLSVRSDHSRRRDQGHSTWVGLILTVTLLMAGPAGGEPVVWKSMQDYGQGRASSVSFSADGTKILAARAWNAYLLDATTGQILRTLYGQFGGISRAAFSPDGKRVITINTDYTARIWDAETGVVLRTFTCTRSVYSVAFSPDGTKILITCNDNSVKLWDANTGAMLLSLFGDPYSTAFSPDGSMFLTGSESSNTADLFRTDTGTLVRSFRHGSPGYPLYSVAFSPDGSRILTGSGDSKAKMWDVGTGTLLQTFTGDTWITSVAFSPDGTKVLTRATYGNIRLWDTNTGSVLRVFSPSGRYSDLATAAFSPDGTKILAGGWQIRVWDAETGDILLASNPGHEDFVFSARFSPDGTKVLTGSWDMSAKLWDTDTSTVLRTFSGHSTYVYSVAFSPDGTRIATGSSDKTARLWDVNTGAVLQTWNHSTEVFLTEFSPDGTKLLTDDGYTAKLWDVETGAILQTFTGHTGNVYAVAFLPNGTGVLTAGSDKTAKLWDVNTGQALATYANRSVRAFSPDGSMFLTVNGTDVELRSIQTGALLRTFTGYSYSINRAAFSSDGTRILTSGSDSENHYSETRLLDITTGALLRRFRSPAGVFSVAFSPDGTGVLTASSDGTARLWFAGPLTAADFDFNGSVDRDDLELFTFCATGPGGPYDPAALPYGCTLVPEVTGRIAADFDNDSDVDQEDFGKFQRCLGGLALAEPGCAE